MTASLPDDVQQVFDRFITTEYTTIDRAGQPITWPVTPYYSPGDPCIDVTTGLGYPKKARDAEANPKVALLFSDPTGCGLDNPPQVLVQGIADVDDRDLDANRERYGRESIEKLPARSRCIPPKPLQRLFGWYFTRIYVHVRPERVYVWPNGDSTAEPQLLDSHLEEVRSGHDEEPEAPPPPPQGGEPIWDERMDELGDRYEDAVLSLVAPDGFPFSVRLPISVDREAQRVRFGGGARRRARSAGSGLPHRPRPPPRVQVAAELPGPRRPRRGGRRLGARAAQDGGRLRAAAGVAARPLPPEREEDEALPQDRKARNGPPRLTFFRKMRDQARATP